MRKQLKYYITAGLFALLFLSIQSCKKDYIKCLECDKCKDFPRERGSSYGIITQKPLQRKAPCFNPNNGSEFIYVKEENRKQSLVKFNLNTRQETILLENTRIVGQPKWGRNGWIVFIGSDYQIYTIESNGNNLTKKTFKNNHLYPDWKNDSIIISEFTFNLGIPYFYSEYNLNSQLIDTIRNTSFTLGSVNRLGEKAYLSYRDDPNISFNNNYQIVNLTNFNYPSKIRGRNRVEGICWHPNNEEIYYSTYREGLYKIDKNTKKLYKIRNGCDSRSYRYLSISPDWQHILVERVDATDFINNNGNWTEESNIYYLTINGEYERKVF